MKRLVLILLLSLSCMPIYCQLTQSSSKDEYLYIDTPINSMLLIHNLKMNAQGYVAYNGWGQTKSTAFYESLDLYIKAIEQGRLSSEISGSIRDNRGELNNGNPIIFDKNNRVITSEEYNKLKEKKKKQCSLFYPNKTVARYIDKIAKLIYEKQLKESDPAYMKDKSVLNSFKQSKIKP